MRLRKSGTEFIAIRDLLIENLQIIVDYFLDDAVKHIIRKYDLQEMEQASQNQKRFEAKIKIIGIKTFIIYQNLTKHMHNLQITIIRITQKYFYLPLLSTYNNIKTHPISIITKRSILSILVFYARSLKIIMRLFLHYALSGYQILRDTKILSLAQNTRQRLKRVVEAAFCYTKQSRMFRKSKELYNFVQKRYLELKRKFSCFRNQIEYLSSIKLSQESDESFIFPEQHFKNKILKVRSNQNIKKVILTSRFRGTHNLKSFEIGDEDSSQKLALRKPSVSQYGGYSSDDSF